MRLHPAFRIINNINTHTHRSNIHTGGASSPYSVAKELNQGGQGDRQGRLRDAEGRPPSILYVYFA